MKETINEKTGEVTTELDEEERQQQAARSFVVFLGKVADGDLEVQASQDLLTLSKAIQTQARAQQKTVKGSLTITVDFAGDESGTLDVSYEIKRKDPKPRRARSVFWINKQGNVVSQNPRQIELGLRDVSRKPAPRDVGARTEG